MLQEKSRQKKLEIAKVLSSKLASLKKKQTNLLLWYVKALAPVRDVSSSEREIEALHC